MRRELLKDAGDSTTITTADLIKKVSAVLLVINAVSIGVSTSVPDFYDKYISRTVAGLNATGTALGIGGASLIKKGRINAGGLRLEGSEATYGERLLLDSAQELDKVEKAVQVVDRLAMSPEAITQKVNDANRLEGEKEALDGEKKEAVKQLSLTQKELEREQRKLKDYQASVAARDSQKRLSDQLSAKSHPHPPQSPDPLAEEDELFRYAANHGRVLDATHQG